MSRVILCEGLTVFRQLSAMQIRFTRLVCALVWLPWFAGVSQAEVFVQAPPEFYQGLLEPNLYFRPNQLAAAPDGSLFVEDDAADKIYHFSESGELLHSFASPGPGFQAVYGMATDAAGNLHTLSTFGDLSVFSPSGGLLSVVDVNAEGRIAIAPDGLTYIARSGFPDVYRVDSGGALTRFTEPNPTSSALLDLQFNSQGELYTLRGGFSPVVSVYDASGALQREFAVPDHPFVAGVNPGSMAVTDDSLYLYDDYLASVRRFSLTGEPLGIANGVPFARDLAVTASGDVLASLPSLRVVEKVTPDLFGEDSVGTTRVSMHAPHLVSGAPLSPQISLEPSQGWRESTAHSFIVPGAPGEVVSLRFDRLPYSGSPSNDVISVFPVDAVTADPRESHAQYLIEAFENSIAHLGSHLTGTLAEIEVPAGTELGFVSFSRTWGDLLGTTASHVAAYRDRVLSLFG
ncbi:MAG: hypothetical protein KDA37_15430, partial [Planctomycetales bacterium]|nr:hypothetical protein [Planctomycetales bacterium]